MAAPPLNIGDVVAPEDTGSEVSSTGMVVDVVPDRAALTRTFSAVAVLFAVFALHGFSAVAYECHEPLGGDGDAHGSVHDETAPSSGEDHGSGHHGENLVRCASAPCASAVVADAGLDAAGAQKHTTAANMARSVRTTEPSAPEPPVPKFLL